MQSATLGRSGIVTSILCFGTGSSGYSDSSNQTRLGQDRFTALVRHAYENGVRCFDCAGIYGSHPYLRHALKGIPREQITIITKTFERHPEGIRRDLDTFRTELGVDYIDGLMLHCIAEADWTTRYRANMDVLSEAKAKGAIRAHGCSFHSQQAQEAAVTEPWVDLALARYNPWGLNMVDHPVDDHNALPVQALPVIQRLHEHGAGVMAMKLIGQGKPMQGDNIERRITQSLCAAVHSNAFDVYDIGFESIEQFDQVFRILNQVISNHGPNG